MVNCCPDWFITLNKLIDTTSGKGLKITWISLLIISLFLFTLFIFWLIATEIVLEHENKFDASVFAILDNITSPGVTMLMRIFTFFGSTLFLLPAYILLTGYFLFKKNDKKLSLQVATIGITSTISLFVLKKLFHRTRPVDELIPNVEGFSFPSGHSFSSFTFFGLITYLIWKTNLGKPWKYFYSVMLFLFCCAIATSRVYLHVHYASDVVAGFCLSIVWLIGSLKLLSLIRNQAVVT
jgi:undecaprenyl-diphosphatase